MGKPKSSKRKHEEGNNGNNKRRKGSQSKQGKKQRSWSRDRYWIEDCKDSKSKKGEAEMTVTITRRELTENDMHIPSDRDKKMSKSLATSESPNYVQQESEAKSDLPSTEKDQREGSVVKATSATLKPVEETAHISSGENEVSNETENQNDMLQGDYSNAFISIRRASSAKRIRKHPFENFKHLPNGDCGDGIKNPSPEIVADKFWAQRRRLFSRFDEGIKLDKESWYSVTPEAIANHIAGRIGEKGNQENNKLIVLDAFCGCGGNAISLGNRPEILLVVCVDTDRSKLKLAAHNASIYGVPANKIVFLEADACGVMTSYEGGKRLAAATDATEEDPEECHGYAIGGGLSLLPDRLDAIFLSPPWGGMDYEKVGRRNYELATCITVSSTNTKDADSTSSNGEDLLVMAASALKSRLVIYFLPRNVNGVSMGRSALKAGFRGQIELEQNVVNGKFKTITGYLGFEGTGIPFEKRGVAKEKNEECIAAEDSECLLK